MNLYPALTFRAGTWTYYVVNMSMQELADNVHFASEVNDDRTLDEAIQRVLNESRVKGDIITYLKRQPDRFFSSIVVAAVGGDPKFYPVEIADDERFAIFADDKRLNETFGVLKFDSPKYYALDGQHRLAAIKTMLDKQAPESDGAPPNFGDDQISVIVVVPNNTETDPAFMQRYRRLFSNLNRYAKPMDAATNIIMDEDDAFAILTRRLITEHEFFKSSGRQKESRTIKTGGSKNLSSKDPYFTSIIGLYEMNETILSSRQRKNSGWGEGEKVKTYKLFRPDDEQLEELYAELTACWDAILRELPVLRKPPEEMRIHDLNEEDLENGFQDNLLFWPIGQGLLADLIREAIDLRLPEDAELTSDSVSRAIKGLGELEWRLHEPPWRYFLLTFDPNKESWKMRDEDRVAAVRIGLRLQRWLFGLDDLDRAGIDSLRAEWMTRLTPAMEPREADQLWSEIAKSRS